MIIKPIPTHARHALCIANTIKEHAFVQKVDFKIIAEIIPLLSNILFNYQTSIEKEFLGKFTESRFRRSEIRQGIINAHFKSTSENKEKYKRLDTELMKKHNATLTFSELWDFMELYCDPQDVAEIFAQITEPITAEDIIENMLEHGVRNRGIGIKYEHKLKIAQLAKKIFADPILNQELWRNIISCAEDEDSKLKKIDL